MNLNETIETGRKYRVKNGSAWKRFSFWTKASDVECDDGETMEQKADTIKNSVHSLDVSGSAIVYTKNDGSTKSLPIPTASCTLNDLGISATAEEINKLHAIDGAICTEQKAAELISQKIPPNINGTPMEGSADGTISNMYKIGNLTVMWGNKYVEFESSEWDTGEDTVQFDTPFSGVNTYQFIYNVEGQIRQAVIKDKAVDHIDFTITKTDPTNCQGNIIWIAIGY